MSIASVSHSQVFGIKQEIKDNLFTVDDDTILYPAGSNIIIAQKNHKRFIPVSEKGDTISCLTVSHDRHLLALGERGTKPSINIYDVVSARKRRLLTPSAENTHSKEFVSLAFSSDSKYLAAQLSGPEWILHYFAWDKGKLLAQTISHSNDHEQSVLQVSVNPTDGTVVFVLGSNFFKLYRYSEGGLRSLPIQVSPSKNNFQCHVWISNERIVIGSQTGQILIFTQTELFQTIHTTNYEDPTSSTPTPQNLCSIEGLVCTSQGFISANRGGQICIYTRSKSDTTGEEMYAKTSTLPSPDGYVRTIAISSTEGSFLVEVESNQILAIPLANFDEHVKEIQFSPMTQPFHGGNILGMDICCRKPLIVTCSVDKTIRLWNYLTGSCEFIKHYPEEAFSCSLHPSGLYLLVGFIDKLRLMNVLMDDFRFFKEFPIRGCKECRFSNGGHIFAAVHGNMIQIYNTWTFEIIGALKGHNGKVKSLHWSPDDSFLVSAGSDGAVYTWNIRDLKRENEYILKSCAYSSAICNGTGKIVYAVGSDRMVKEVTESQVTCEYDGGVVSTQILLSNSGKMLFIGTSSGTIRSVKYPFTGDVNNFQEHFAHSAPVTKMRMSYDDQYLFSASEDGTIYSYRVAEKEERGIKRERAHLFVDEILITKSDLEEKNVIMNELQNTFNELKLEHEYQLRLKDMSFGEKMKDITEMYSQEIEGLKIMSSVLRTEKDKEEIKHEEEVLHIKSQHGSALHVYLMIASCLTFKEIESKYNLQLMEEYDKYQDSQLSMTSNQENWLNQVKTFELNTQKVLADTQTDYETKLKLKSNDIMRLQEEMRQDTNEFAEMVKQNDEDLDTEIVNLISKYEKKLRIEKDEGARLKGENGIMRKKFNTLNKDIDDNKTEIMKMRDDEKKLQTVISTLEREISVLKKEMSERDELIQDKERRVYDLKKKNQELEKFKFVLDYNIKYLKQQVEPRENHISEMTEQIHSTNRDLEVLSKSKIVSETKIFQLTDKLTSTKKDFTRQHQKVLQKIHYLKGFRNDFQEIMIYIQDPVVLKKATEKLAKKYCRNKTDFKNNMVDEDVHHEIVRQHDVLKQQITKLRQSSDTGNGNFKSDEIQNMSTNQSLLIEINELRKINRQKPHIKKKIVKVVIENANINVNEEDDIPYSGKLPSIRSMTAPLPPLQTFKNSIIQT